MIPPFYHSTFSDPCSASLVALLSTESPLLFLQHVTHAKLISIAEVSTKIAMAVDKFLSKQQKALFLQQQLAAVNTKLHSSSRHASHRYQSSPCCFDRGMAPKADASLECRTWHCDELCVYFHFLSNPFYTPSPTPSKSFT
jgi:hypothetical protein